MNELVLGAGGGVFSQELLNAGEVAEMEEERLHVRGGPKGRGVGG